MSTVADELPRPDLDTEWTWPWPPVQVSDQAQTVVLSSARTVSLTVHHGTAGADTTVLLVHGAGGHQDQWRALWAPLVNTEARVVAFDFPGHGYSPKPREASTYRGEALRDDLIAVLDRFPARRHILVAHSYGVRLSLAALLHMQAQGQRHTVEQLVLLGPQAPDQPFQPGPLARVPAWVLALMRGRLSRQFRAAAWGANADPRMVDQETRLTDRNPMHVVKALFTQGMPPPGAVALGALTLPAQVLAGAEDRVTPPEGARALAVALPQGRLTVLPGCGHQIMLEQPQAVWDAVRSALGEGDTSAGA